MFTLTVRLPNDAQERSKELARNRALTLTLFDPPLLTGTDPPTRVAHLFDPIDEGGEMRYQNNLERQVRSRSCWRAPTQRIKHQETLIPCARTLCPYAANATAHYR